MIQFHCSFDGKSICFGTSSRAFVNSTAVFGVIETVKLNHPKGETEVLKKAAKRVHESQATRLGRLRDFMWKTVACARRQCPSSGINRHVVEKEKVLEEWSSEPP